jgi:hypothetical protein
LASTAKPSENAFVRGSLAVAAGFTESTFPVFAAGEGNARNTRALAELDVHGNCRRYFSNAPSLKIQVAASGGPPRIVLRARSSADTTLAVHTPDGAWLCDDDSGRAFDPELRIAAPRAGDYRFDATQKQVTNDQAGGASEIASQ